MAAVRTPIREFVADREVPSLSPGASVADAARLMHRLGSDSVLVISSEGTVVGVFTERDFLNRVIAEGRTARDTRLADVMTSDPEVLEPSAPISYAMNLMGVRRFRNVPIVDGSGRALAMLGVRDVIRHLSELLTELDTRPLDDPATSPWVDIGGGD